MLKIEKAARLSPALLMREKDPLFTPFLLKAALYAFLLHFGAYALFRIQPLSLASTFLFEPIQIQVEQQISHQKQLMQEIVTLQPLRPSYALITPPSLLEIWLDRQPIPYPDFGTLEARYLPEKEKMVERPAVRLFISGELANYPFTAPFEPQTVQVAEEQEPYFVNYDIKAAQTGEILWFQSKGAGGEKEMEKLAESLLNSMRFTLLPFYMLEGSVHFVFYRQAYD
ncbi:MAG: hypothetical protein LW832_06395 [Parachlamydia sp.]|jgi:hypothetical protein|nr:hypothetical protein [Parachlamydia sp.]